MNCLKVMIGCKSSPMSVSMEAIPPSIRANFERRCCNLSAIFGLVCSVGDTTVSLVSNDGYGLLSKDGYLLYGKRL